MKTNVVYFMLFFIGVLQVSFAQKKTLTGVVRDENQEPMLGVSVIIKGTSEGVSTDENGVYTLKVKDGDEVEVSAMGYKTQVHKVTAKTKKWDVLLALDVEEIPEFVFVGFGQKQVVKEATGSLGKVDNVSTSAASVDKALTGKVAGVQGGVTTGQPGGAANIRIRGIASVNGRTNPIYIIDGVRVNQGDFSQNTTSTNVLANLNDDDIESITVLKDAVSTAAYGADAGAGVIIITTKSGKKGEAKYKFNSEVGFVSRAIKGEESLSTNEWLGILYDAYLNSDEGKATFTSKADLMSALAAGSVAGSYGGTIQDLYNKRHVNTNWRALTENKTALMQKINGSVTGGNERLSYYTSLGYYQQDGIIKNTGFHRVTNANKITFQASDRLTLSTDIQLSYGQTFAQGNGGRFDNPVLGQYLLQPTDPAYNADGSFYYGEDGSLNNGLDNVVALQHLNYMKAQTTRGFGNFQADYKILKGLTYKFTFAPEYIDISEDQYESPLHGYAKAYRGAGRWYSTRIFSFNVQNMLSYDFKLKDKNNFTVNLIQEAYKTDRRVLGAEARAIGTDKLQTLSNFITPRSTTGRRFVNTRGGYALTFHYDYDKLFLLDLSGRQDRISNFWEENKTGYFGSVGVGVDFARLEALKNSKFLSQLKLSASYGSVGNMVDVSPYSTYRYLYNYNDNPGAYPYGVDNKDLRWETLSPFNVGLDLGFLKDRFTVSVAYFHKKTKDMIFAVPLSKVQGSPDGSRYTNIGEMVNKGFEFTIGAKIIENEGDGFNWEVNGNLSTLKNEVTKLYGDNDIINDNRIVRKGESVNSFYLKKWAGVDPQDGSPLWYVDGVGGATTKKVGEAKYAVQGSHIPTLYGGFDTKLSYKNVTLSAQFSYGAGNKILDYFGRFVKSDGTLTATYPGYRSQVGNYWTPENRNADLPKPMLGRKDNSTEYSTRYLYKGDYLRLQTLRLSYKLKSEWLEGTYFKGLEIYALGDNLWTHTFDKNFKGDPDLVSQGYTNFALPSLRTVSVGINVNL